MRPARRLTRMALLTGIALTIFLVEAQIPAPVPVPGVKLGLSNIITVYAVFSMGPGSACAILAARLLLGAACTGRISALLYSAAGGLCAIAATILLRPLLTRRQLWVAGAAGALAHSLGQMAAAIVLTGTRALILYLPVMLLCSLFTGLFTGLAAQFLCSRMDRLPKEKIP